MSSWKDHLVDRPPPTRWFSERRRRALGGLLLVAAVVLAAIFTLARLPDITTTRLPGAAGGSDTYPVQAEFTDVLDLVPNSTVRLADVPIGRVTTIDLAPGGPAGYHAVAHLELDRAYALPADTVATIRTTSLLGEKYVALTAPEGGTGSLREVGTIPLDRTTQDVEIEQLLASIGAVLNGGGLQQISTITREFATALDGREQDTRELLGNLDSIIGRLDAGKPALVAALDSVTRLSAAFAAQNRVLGDAVVALDPATGVLAEQQRNLTKALRSLQTLDAKATKIIRASTRGTVADLNALVPVTRELGKVANLIPENLTLIVTYPFADNSVPAFSGSYGALIGSAVVNLPQLLATVVPTNDPPIGSTGPTTAAVPGPTGTGKTGDPLGLPVPLPVPVPVPVPVPAATNPLGSLLGGLGGLR